MRGHTPYADTIDTSIPWLGKVPSHWHVHHLRRAVTACINGVWGSEPDGDNDIAVIRVADFNRTTLSVTVDEYTRRAVPKKDRKGRLLQRRDLLLEKSGGGEKQLVGAVVIYDKPEPAVTSNFVARMPLARGYDSGFLCYAFNHLYSGRVNYPSIKQTTGIQNLDAYQYLTEYFCFPPTDEQENIAAFLDHETAKIDRLIAKQGRLIELLKEKRQAVISHAVTKGLNPDAPMKDSGVEWLGEVPAHWEVARLKHVATLQSGIAKGRNLDGKESVRVPYLRVANVQDGYLKLDEISEIEIQPEELPRYLLRSGDVLMNEGGDNDKLGRGAVWRSEINPCIHQNHVFAIRPQRVEPDWLTLVTQTNYAKFYFYSVAKQSTNLASISSTNIKETSLVVPPTDERNGIRDFIKKELDKYDHLMKLADQQVMLLKEHRTALISAAVTGKIDVRGWQKSDTKPKETATAVNV